MMAKVMLVALCLISLALCAGALNPATETDEHVDTFDKLRTIILKTLGNWKERTKSDPASLQQYLGRIPQSNETSILIWTLDKMERELLQGIDTLEGLWHKYSSSHEYPEGFTQSSQSTPDEKYKTESTAATPSSTVTEPSTSESVTYGENDYNPNPSDKIFLRGIPGVHFPDYTDIPVTSFTCSSKTYIPGFYADLETGCQVFHVCWPHRRESFLCPIGTRFNQAILACDFWYSSNCSLAQHYYDVNAQSPLRTSGKDSKTLSMIDLLLGKNTPESALPAEDFSKLKDSALSYITKFLPVKAKVVVFPETMAEKSKIVAEASIGRERKTQTRKPSVKISEPQSLGAKTASKKQIQKVSETSAKGKVVNADRGINTALTIVDNVLGLVTKILGETEKIYKNLYNAKLKVRKPTSNRLPPLTPLNKKFITKPVEMPKTNKRVKSGIVKRKGQAPEVDPQLIGSKTTHVSKMHTTSISQEMHVSELTKNVLVQNYLRLLLMKNR